jgi:hypothetical protein
MYHGDMYIWEIIMKKFGLSSLVAGLLAANAAVAAPTVVEGGAVFTAANGFLTVRLVDAVDPLKLVPPSDASCPATTPVPNATDVVVKDGTAFVTTSTGTVATVDVSTCVSSYCDAEPVVNLNDGHKGELFIPCLDVNGKRYDITMEQRGSSMNWEVVGFPDSEHHHGHDDDHADDNHKH